MNVSRLTRSLKFGFFCFSFLFYRVDPHHLFW